MWRRSRRATQPGLIGRLHVDSLALIIPISRFVDSLHFREPEFDASELELVFSLHVGRADNIVSLRRVVGGCIAMQIDQPFRYEFKGFAVLSVVIEKRVLQRGVL